MLKGILLFIFSFFTIAATAQSLWDDVIDDGVALHDKGDYEAALRKYDEVIKNEPGNARAWYEKSYTLFIMKSYKESEEICKELLKGKYYRKEVYVTYGNLLDITDRQKESLELYERGIKEFPEFSLLYFNKGITLSGMDRNPEAIQAFQQSLKLKPLHPSSHYALGKLMQDEGRVPAIMSMYTFLLIEPQSQRSAEILELLHKLMNKGVSKSDSGNVTVSIDAASLEKKKNAENDFSNSEMLLSLAASMRASNSTQKDVKDTEHMTTFIALLNSTVRGEQKKANGFFWTFYVPFLLELESKGYLDTASYIVYASTGSEEVGKWLKENSEKTNAFYSWLKSYSWNTK